MTTVRRLEAQQRLPDWSTFVASSFFVLMMVVATIACWQAERSVHGFQIRFDIAFLWFISALGGANVWMAYKRNQMTKPISDMLLVMLGMGLMFGAELVDKLAGYASLTALGLN